MTMLFEHDHQMWSLLILILYVNITHPSLLSLHLLPDSDYFVFIITRERVREGGSQNYLGLFPPFLFSKTHHLQIGCIYFISLLFSLL